MAIYDIERYAVFLLKPSGNDEVAQLKCWAEIGTILYLRFYDRPVAQLPSNGWNATNTQGYIYLTAAMYPWALDLLRNERPVRMQYNADGSGFYIGTSLQEPVGVGDEA